MNNLNANYKRILEVLRKISKEQLLTYQRHQPKLSELELISLSLSAEFMVMNSEKDLFKKLPDAVLAKKKNEVSITDEDENLDLQQNLYNEMLNITWDITIATNFPTLCCNSY